MHARALKPDRVCHLDWRGAQLIAVAAETVTIRLHLEQHVVGTREVSRVLLPPDVAAVVGAAVIVRVTGTGQHDYTIEEVKSARFAQPGPGADEAGAVAAGRFNRGHIPYEMFGEEPFWPE